MELFDYEKTENSPHYNNWLRLFRIIFRMLFSCTVIGEENIPENNFIFCANHISHIDFLLAPHSKHLPDLHYMAMSELFKKPVQAAFLKSMNCFPVVRGENRSAQALEYSVRLLKSGHNLAIFPEGELNKTHPYSPQIAKSGIARIAVDSKTQVLPCAIYCKGKIRPFKKIYIVYGKPVPFEEIENVFRENNDYRETANYIFSKTKRLWEMASKC
ncbi:MAG: 1-acyl-sn-glycerol-3-phosphate acyltransferase [Clostridiales bacterium]|nr:1-acyl-sn-glycerol-3-phosphate acyltransferase [Clostridiales bacterium]